MPAVGTVPAGRAGAGVAKARLGEDGLPDRRGLGVGRGLRVVARSAGWVVGGG